MTRLKKNHPALELIDELVFKPCGLTLSHVATELESKEYAACNFRLNGQNVKFRLAKITPAKVGQFVTIWKRNEKGITQPFDISDGFDLYIIAVRKEDQSGLFIFPTSVLHDKKILSGKTRDGKRGTRVYPAWDITLNKQAQKTQQWQLKYFVAITQAHSIDFEKVTSLFKPNK